MANETAKEENILDELTALAENKEYRALKDRLAELNNADAAEFLESLPAKLLPVVFRTLPKAPAAEIFSYLSQTSQERLINVITAEEASKIIDELNVDDAVDALEELPANVVKKILRHTEADTRRLINQFLNYPDDSAGSIMTAEFVDLRQEMTVSQAFERIRGVGLDSETVYTCYVTDNNRRLEGVITVRRLFLSDLAAPIKDIMDTDIISVQTTVDREDVAKMISKYDFLSLPVVDQEERLVGIITVDDIVDVIREEATEDIEKMAAMLPSQRPYLQTGVLELAKNRIVWLLVLMISAMITGHVLDTFQSSFLVMPLLVTFIPMLMDTGGNAGSQSSTMIIRGMALSEIKLADAGKVLWKEIRVSLLVGFILGLVNFIRLYFTYGYGMVGLVVALSLLVTVVIAKSIGCLMPLLAQLLRFDPAIMAAPLITTMVDAISMILYFNIARVLLGL
ncbi:MAG: magnesium transporter [Peptococcaceae bacterium]|jgi:magnesium transporter|nr:magnesium transporter [Peptococcaceae bacterium]